MVPIFTIQLMKLMDRADMHRSVKSTWDTEYSPFLGSNHLHLNKRYAVHPMADTAWEITVATAAPTTAMLKTLMNSRSRPMFKTTDTPRK